MSTPYVDTTDYSHVTACPECSTTEDECRAIKTTCCSECRHSPFGVWSTCNRCDRDNWCVPDYMGERDDISGDALEYMCWNRCVFDEDEWEDER